MKIKLPKERIPMSTRGHQIHKSLKDYSRDSESAEIKSQVSECFESDSDLE